MCGSILRPYTGVANQLTNQGPFHMRGPVQRENSTTPPSPPPPPTSPHVSSPSQGSSHSKWGSLSLCVRPTSLCVRVTQWVEPVTCPLSSHTYAPLSHSQQHTVGTAVLLICSSNCLPLMYQEDLSICTIGASTRQQQHRPTWPQQQQQQQQ